jgi:hypothetical protein
MSEDDISPPQSDSDEDRTGTGCRDCTNTIQSRPSAPVIHKFTGGPSGLRQNEAPHVNKDSLPLSVFMLFFHKIMQLLVEETNRYYRQYLETIAEGRSPLPNMTILEMYLFVSIVLQMGHDQRDRLKDYWSTLEQFFMAFYRNTMKRDRFLHILRFLHFSDNRNEPDKTDENYDRLWKMRTIFDELNDAYAKY